MLSPVVNTVPGIVSSSRAVASPTVLSHRSTSPAPTRIGAAPGAVTATVAPCRTAMPLIVAVTSFTSATADPNVPVATPLGSVGPLGCVSVLSLPVTASSTRAPLTGFPAESRAVTVIVAVPFPASRRPGPARTVERDGDTAGASWQVPTPESVAVCPAIGRNRQEYVPSPSVSFSTPYVPLSRTSLLGRTAGPNTFTPWPPVPTVNCRSPCSASATSSGLCGANRSYTRSCPLSTTSAPASYNASHNGFTAPRTAGAKEELKRGCSQYASVHRSLLAARSARNHCSCAEPTLIAMMLFNTTMCQAPR